MCAAVTDLLRRGVASPFSHGAGRYFDGFGALFLGRMRAGYEGQVAAEWEQIAAPDETKAYAFDIDLTSEPWQLDLRPMVRGAVADFARGAHASTIAAAFHNTLAEATALLVRRVADHETGRLPVVASGGCFQNAGLVAGLRRALASEFDLRLNRQVPCGDGGIALGQAVIVNALTRDDDTKIS